MKIAAVVILYHPAESTLANIESYYDYVEEIFVYDNTEEGSLLTDRLKSLSKILLFHDSENKGIARRLNEACKTAIQKQFDWVLTMDQDSNFSPDAINFYFRCFYSYQRKESVAMFGTNRGREINLNTNDCQPREIQDLITSGSLLNLSLFNEIGGFDESLFIDLVDNEYCARARMKGYSIIIFTNIHLFHELGKQVYNSSVKSLFIIKKKKEVHSPLRCYYMYRNLLYIKNKYKEYDQVFVKKLRKDVLARIKICILYGREAWKILKYLKAGKRDFINGHMGKIKKEP